ncbi:MAG: MltA domain-containing protein [Phycisphaerales bacterium]|nr:MltA domain-containing protein [Phycisphaerales bacterium]
MKSLFPLRCLIALLLALLPLAACGPKQAPIIEGPTDKYDTPVVGWGLRKLDTKDYPDMRAAWNDTTNLERAIDKSIHFLQKPSSSRFYPSANQPEDTITCDQILKTLYDMKVMLHKNLTPDQFQQEILTRYDVYSSKGYNDKGGVQFTGYFTPIYHGSRTRTAEYQYPIYSRPHDLVTDPITGKVMGTAYPVRRELMQSGRLNGLELLWFKKPLEPFMIQVQGSAQVIIDATGETLYVGYAGSNDAEHVGLGTQLVRDGKVDGNHLSLPVVIDYFEQHPAELKEYILRDDRMTFQKIYTAAEAASWPTGSLNEQVTPERSLATDKSIFPRASLTFIDVDKPDMGGKLVPYKGFLLDQDSGGGIRAAGRADIYMGIGDQAGRRAGNTFALGRLYYLFLKPQVAPPSPPQ